VVIAGTTGWTKRARHRDGHHGRGRPLRRAHQLASTTARRRSRSATTSAPAAPADLVRGAISPLLRHPTRAGAQPPEDLAGAGRRLRAPAPRAAAARRRRHFSAAADALGWLGRVPARGSARHRYQAAALRGVSSARRGAPAPSGAARAAIGGPEAARTPNHRP
jgi:hypothetical protein